MKKELPYRIRASEHGNILEMIGIDFGNELKVIDQNKYLYLCQCSGYVGWAHQGSISYYNPKFVIVDRRKISIGSMSEHYYKCFTYDRKNKKEIYNRVINYFNKIKSVKELKGETC